MASPNNIKLSVTDAPVFSFNPKVETAEKASELLQKDEQEHNIYFNDMGFHNHIDHHVLSIYALGASPEDVDRAYASGSSYQRPALPVDEDVVKRLSNKDEFRKLAGKREHYPNFLHFFKQEIESKGVGSVVQKYLFAGGEFADEMLARLFGGLIHPLIHLGFGIEFNQPSIIAQGLAQTATHNKQLETFFQSAEKMARDAGKPSNKTLVQLQDELRNDSDIKQSVEWADSSKFFDGVMHRCPEKMIEYASQFNVDPSQFDEKLAELINSTVYFTGTAQNPKKAIRFDFFYIHALNSNIFLPAFFAQSWMTKESKVRLLEWKARNDLLTYVSRGCTEPHLEDITNYPAKLDWKGVFKETVALKQDDGHAAKFIRHIAHGEKVCKPYEEKDGFRIKGDMWLKLGNMLVDSIHAPGPNWVRSAGFEEAWEEIPARQ
ncbi:hypothetical protein A7D00_4254 [Trichophyton violaceum]|uniref:HypA protein n=1 Tax=Trichophyton violaceum TaxID=34388 RepID=A0A178FIG7_TRIVO|nr:hypothetical protein A7D00_4254 [Trichophyton violaceum]